MGADVGDTASFLLVFGVLGMITVITNYKALGTSVPPSSPAAWSDALGRSIAQQSSQTLLEGAGATKSPEVTRERTINGPLGDAPLHSHSDDLLHSPPCIETSVHTSRPQSPLLSSASASALADRYSTKSANSSIETNSRTNAEESPAASTDGTTVNNDPSIYESLTSLSGRMEFRTAVGVVLAFIQLVYGWKALFIATVNTSVELAVKGVFALGCLAVPLIIACAVSRSLEADMKSSFLLQICWVVDAVMLCSSVYVIPERLGLIGFVLVCFCGLASLEGMRAAYTTDGPLAPGPGVLSWELLTSGISTSLMQMSVMLIYSGILITRICGPTVSPRAWHRPVTLPHTPVYAHQLHYGGSRTSTRSSSPVPALRERSVTPSPRSRTPESPSAVPGRKPSSHPATPTLNNTRPMKTQIAPTVQNSVAAERPGGRGAESVRRNVGKVNTKGSDNSKAVGSKPGTTSPVSIVQAVAQGALSVGGSGAENEARALGSAVLAQKGSASGKVEAGVGVGSVKPGTGSGSNTKELQANAQTPAQKPVPTTEKNNTERREHPKVSGESRTSNGTGETDKDAAQTGSLPPTDAVAKDQGSKGSALPNNAATVKTHLSREYKSWAAYRGYLRDVERDPRTKKLRRFKCDADTMFAQPLFLALTSETLFLMDVNRRISNQYQRSRISEVRSFQESNFFTGDKKYIMFQYSGDRPDHVVFQSDYAPVVVKYLQTPSETPPLLKVSNALGTRPSTARGM